MQTLDPYAVTVEARANVADEQLIAHAKEAASKAAVNFTFHGVSGGT